MKSASTLTQRTPSRLMLSVLGLSMLSGALTACVPLVVGGAMGSGALVATDRRTSGTQLEDEGIELRALSRLRGEVGDRSHINLTSYNRQVLLTGEASSEQDKQLIEQIVSRVENVNAIVNELAVMGNSSLAQRSSDALVTGRVKAMMVDAKDLQANSFKVVTERGTTYLMGRVTQQEADRATEVVRGTPGVLKVVRVLEILTPGELAGVRPAPVVKE